MSVTLLNTTSNLSGKTVTIAEGTHTITGAWTFSRSPSAPFAVTSGSAMVTNLDADKLDGIEGSGYARLGFANAGHLIFTDATYDIGASGATRPRNLYLSAGIAVGGNIDVTGTVTVTGGQIIFPAAQSASSNANTLDDYEEGNWTPADGSGAALSFTSVTGQYIKIGKMVSATAVLTYPANADGTQAKITGLPFTADTTANMYGGMFHYNGAATASIGWIVLANTITAIAHTTAAAAVTNANLTTAQIAFTIVYRATA